jgi:hypothetical protein
MCTFIGTPNPDSSPLNASSKILNRPVRVKGGNGPDGHGLAPPFADFSGGGGVFYILACLLGVPISLIVLFLVLLPH